MALVRSFTPARPPNPARAWPTTTQKNSFPRRILRAVLFMEGAVAIKVGIRSCTTGEGGGGPARWAVLTIAVVWTAPALPEAVQHHTDDSGVNTGQRGEHGRDCLRRR